MISACNTHSSGGSSPTSIKAGWVGSTTVRRPAHLRPCCGAPGGVTCAPTRQWRNPQKSMAGVPFSPSDYNSFSLHQRCPGHITRWPGSSFEGIRSQLPPRSNLAQHGDFPTSSLSQHLLGLHSRLFPTSNRRPSLFVHANNKLLMAPTNFTQHLFGMCYGHLPTRQSYIKSLSPPSRHFSGTSFDPIHVDHLLGPKNMCRAGHLAVHSAICLRCSRSGPRRPLGSCNLILATPSDKMLPPANPPDF